MTDAELATLGLIADLGPCSGYTLVKVATERGMARWAGLSASSVYGCAGKLRRMGMVCVEVPTQNVGRGPTGRRYRISRGGKTRLRAIALQTIADSVASAARFRIALACAHHLSRRGLCNALSLRVGALEERIAGLKCLRREQGIGNAPLGAQLLFDETLASLQHEVQRGRAVARKLA